MTKNTKSRALVVVVEAVVIVNESGKGKKVAIGIRMRVKGNDRKIVHL